VVGSGGGWVTVQHNERGDGRKKNGTVGHKRNPVEIGGMSGKCRCKKWASRQTDKLPTMGKTKKRDGCREGALTRDTLP